MDGIHIYRRLEEMPDAFRQFFDAANAGPSADFSLTPQWLSHLASTTRAENQEVRIYAMTRHGAPCLVLPMYGSKQEAAFWRPRRLSSLANYYSSLTGPLLAAPDHERDAILAAAIRHIARERPRWDSVDLHPLALEGDALTGLSKALRAAGMAVQAYFCFGNWYLEVGGRSYQHYFNALPSRLRNTIIRKTQQLEAAGRLRVDLVTRPEDVEQGIAGYEAIYRSSWKRPEPFPAFIPGLIRLCAQQGWLRLGIAYVDGQPAAAQIWIVHQGVASIYKLAYDAAFGRFSVGSILTARLMQHVIDHDQVREVDYLMGDDAYKQDWMSHRRERWGLRAFNVRTLHGLLGAARHIAGRRIRAWLTGRFQGARLCGENAGQPAIPKISMGKKPNNYEPMI
ncbi:GNAT family N-acetyltransferase [Herbaspirillum lusitanum]|uniref:GNAT family N-acetyltransferase n=1 Tax=Herbaspirillum lusitanum TaxID=213312 RepID=A0ABW9A5H9_9BURK